VSSPHEEVEQMKLRALVVVAAAVLLPASAFPATTAGGLPAQVALDWNAAAVDAVRAATVIDPPGTAPRPLYQTEGLLYTAYVQAAVYDAVSEITRRYEPYHRFSARIGRASAQAAAIAAAYDTLTYYLGDPGGVLAAKYTTAIAALPPDDSTARGLAVGHAAAADLERLRATDGRNAHVATPYGTGPPRPGVWVFAPPPSLQSAQTPWLAFMQPFLLRSPTQFRAPAPSSLSTAQYGVDLREVEQFGSKTSAVRTPEQTAIAWFWNANNVNAVNQTLRDAAVQHGMDLVDATRLLAMGDMVATDAGMTCFRSKYTYQEWRPITAIRATDDPTWIPLGTTPNHPEYPSQHGCLFSALAETLAHALGTDLIDIAVPGAENGATTLTTSQTFHTVDDLDAQLVDARVWIGFHYRSSVVAGEKLGAAVASWALRHGFRPLADEHGGAGGRRKGA
jgi:hypothetical protein